MTRQPSLPKHSVLRHLRNLEQDLSSRQHSRLHALADLIDDTGRIPLARALEVATPPGPDATRLASFRKFRAALAEAAEQADSALELVVDTLKIEPTQRYCWFTGPDSLMEELAEISSIEARTAEAGNAISQSAAELFDPRDIRLYLSTDRTPDREDASAIRLFLDLLKANLIVRTDIRVTIADTLSAPAGTKTGTRIGTADVVIALLSPGYLRHRDSEFDAVLEARSTKTTLFVALDHLPDNPDLRGLNAGEILMKRKPFSTRTRSSRRDFVLTVCEALTSHLNRTPQHPTHAQNLGYARQQLADRLAAYSRGIFARDGFVEDLIVESHGNVTALDASPGSAEAQRPTGQKCVAVTRLVEWALDTSDTARNWCALLGDTGMGKTTTSRLLTARLLDLRDKGKTVRNSSVPLPIYFDLRDLPIREIGPNPSLTRIIEALLTRIDIADNRPSAQELLQIVHQGSCVVIFDGLDEALVHLSPADGQAFTRTLWRAIEQPDSPFVSPVRRARRASKLLLSCRTHYFRSIRHEITHFTGQHRDGPKSRDYLALLMLPFTDKQIVEYLNKHVPGTDTTALLETISSVHNLREMAERPFLLQLMSEELSFVERAALNGTTVRPVDLYGAFTRRWLERDDGKHTLIAEHKLLLMEHLAAELWRSRQSGWSADEIEQWLVDFIRSRPALSAHYGNETSIWKEDLRTATFLVRRGDDRFDFAHTSLREYFVARYLLRALLLGPEAPEQVTAAWAMPVTSVETFDFLGQSLAGVAEHEREKCLASLRVIRDRYWPLASELAFAYALRATPQDHPRHSLVGTVLDGADLSDWVIGSDDGPRLDLRSLCARSARLRRTVFVNVHLGSAIFDESDFTKAELCSATLRTTRFANAELTGAIFRECDLSGVAMYGARPHRTQILRCELGDAGTWRTDGFLMAACTVGGAQVATSITPDQGHLEVYRGHHGNVRSASYRQATARILTCGSDGTVRIWDTDTGEHLTTLTDHLSPLWSGCYSPDGNRILTINHAGTAQIRHAVTGEQLLTLDGRADWATYSPDSNRILATSIDGTVRAWDAVTGERLLTLQGRADWATYSPDSNRILTISDGSTACIWDATTGEHLTTLTGHTGPLWSGSYSPDGHNILTTSNDHTARIWDATTGEHLTTLTGHTGPVRSGSYSPDGHNILTTSNDHTARISDATTGEHLAPGDLSNVGTFLGPTPWSGYSQDGKRIVTIDGYGTVDVWDAGTGGSVTVLEHHGPALSSAEYSPCGRHIVTVRYSGTARIWNAATGKHLTNVPGITVPRNLRASSRHIVTVDDDNTRQVWDTVTGELLTMVSSHSDNPYRIAPSPDGKYIITIDYESIVRIRSTATGEHLTTLIHPAYRADYSPDGHHITTVDDDATARIWNAATGEHLTTLAKPAEWLDFSPDGHHILTTCDDGTAHIWDTATGEHLTTLNTHIASALTAKYSRDGRRIVTVSGDGTSQIWNTSTGEHLITFTKLVEALDCSPDGHHIVIVGHDGTSQIWNIATGEHLTTLNSHTISMRTVEYSPDGHHILTTGDDETARVWDITGTELLRFSALPGGEMTAHRNGQLVHATPGAWRYLGWSVVVDGKLTRLPAETFGPLPMT